MKCYTVYGLREKGSKEVRYIGFTSGPVEIRLAGHLSASLRGRHNRPLCEWLRAGGDNIEIFKIGYADTLEEAHGIERAIIALCLRLEHRLLNQRKLPVSACPLGRNSAQRRTRMYAPPALGGSLEHASEAV